MKSRTFTDEVFGSNFVLLWAGTPEQFARHIRARYDKTYDGDTDFVGRCIDTNEAQIHTVIIMLPEWQSRMSLNERVASISILVHELTHATERALRYRDIEHTVETSEVYAYFLDFLTRRCLNILP